MSENETNAPIENSDDNVEEVIVTEEVIYEDAEEEGSGQEAQAEAPQTQTAVAEPPARRDEGLYWGTGRRKSSVARVRLRLSEDESHLIVNNKPMENYFTVLRWQNEVLAPLRGTQSLERFAIDVNVKGGGPASQAGAVSLGIARALLKFDDSTMEALRAEGLLTRDSRMKERKKYGHKGARKSFQFSKR
jgi:small subunit ribosomal protein S9